MTVRWTVFLALATAACSPSRPNIVHCNSDRNCMNLYGEAQLRCFFDGDTGKYCANPDSSCPSGFRWAPLAQPHVEEQCVDPAMVNVDGGA